MKISYTILFKDEIKEINELLDVILKNMDKKEDEVIIVCDRVKGEDEGWDNEISYFYDCGVIYTANKDAVKTHYHLLNNDFAAQKNYANSLCSGDYIINADSDEIISEYFIQNIRPLLELNSEVDLIYIPRINIVDGITEEHIKKWGWRINEKGWINHPDFQGRLYKNKPEIKWDGKVHERIIGAKSYTYLPPELEEWNIIHKKTIEKQCLQNNYYNTL